MDKKLPQNTYVVSWDEFKAKVSTHIKNHKGGRICRGQSNSKWTLTTSFHRNPSGVKFPLYFNFLNHLADVIGTIEDKQIDISKEGVNGAFLAYLQHHGFPTPLLDWSASPYIAAYFAFSDVVDQSPLSDHISIFVFDHNSWIVDFPQIYNYNEIEPHVSVLRPKILGNRRQIYQQSSSYIWTNVTDIAAHIRQREAANSKCYLEIYNIPIKEKYYAMSDLELMGITAFTLFNTTDALCRYYKEIMFRKDSEGVNAVERIMAAIKRIPTNQSAEKS